MEVKASLALGLQKSIETLRKDDDLCDFTVVVDGTSFQCHRLILRACSGFFQTLFRSQMRESQENQAELQGMTARTFDVIINSVYRGVDGLTKDNVLDVWSATVQLQIRYLTEECENFAMNNVSVDKCFSFLRQAELYSAEKVVTNTLVFISEHFEQLREIENLLQLSFADFYRVIESDYLIVSSEDVVVKTVLKWVDYTHLHSSDCTSNCEEPDTSNCKEPDNSNNLNVSYTNCNNEEINNSASSTIAEGNLVSDHDSSNTQINESNKTVDDSRENEANLTGETSANILCARESQQQHNNGQSTLPGEENGQTGSVSESLIDISSNLNCVKVMPGHYEEVSQNNILVKDQSKGTDRNPHLLTLISTCRLYLISPSCLNNLLHSPTLASCQEALNLVYDAVMYKLGVERRHEPWPKAAVHRVTSNMKHVMVFFSNNKFMAYSLNTGSVQEFADLPEDHTSDSSSFSFGGTSVNSKQRNVKKPSFNCGYISCLTLTVFDNALYLGYVNTNNQGEFHMFVNQRWVKESNLNWNRGIPYKLLAHDNRVFYLENSILFYCEFPFRYSRSWNILCDLKIRVNSDIGIFFQQYILLFYTELNISAKVMYCNVETNESGTLSSNMDGTSQGMVSFTNLGDVFLLQKNGSLWKIFSTDTDPVDFELVSKLWDGDVDLKGCVVYRKELFVFHQKSNPIVPTGFVFHQQSSPIVPTVTEIHVGSVPGLLIKIKMVAVDSESSCLPMVLPQSWFIVEDSK